MIHLSEQPIDIHAVTESVRSVHAGAVVLFLGTVREFTGDLHTDRLEYEAYPQMAEQVMRQLNEEARSRWPLIGVSMVHRTGPLDPGEVAVAVAVSSAHRHPAFEAGQWLMDTLKAKVPIWKKEVYADGRQEWVNPLATAERSGDAE